MAQKVILTLTDDLDGSEASETVSFSVDGVSYEMELNAANAAELRETLAPYRAAGRRLSGSRAAKPARPGAGTKEVRQWAFENGIEVNPRGRVRDEVVQQYVAAQS